MHAQSFFTAAQLAAFVTFAFVTSITPGPNNIMLLVSGLNVGFRRTIPHVVGISAGFGVMIVVVGAGLGSVLLAYPLVYTILRWTSVAYLLYLAWRIGTSRPPDVDDGTGYRPFGFWRAAAFQWINPKAWVMAIAAIVSYAPISSSSTTLGAAAVILLVAAIFAAVNLPSVGMWAYFGSVLQRFLHHPRLVGAINLTMAMLMVASLYPLITE